MRALLLHGAGGGGWEWNLWRGVLVARGIDVVAPDLQPAAAGLEATRLDDYRRQALDAFAALPAPRVAIGASLGGLLALELAGRAGCTAAILVNPLPPAPEALHRPRRGVDAGIVPWRREARLDGTRRNLRGADAVAAIYAFRRWRDEPVAVLLEAEAGITLAPPCCPILVMAADADDDVPAATSAALAGRLGASLVRLPGDHLSPLLGRQAVRSATTAVEWLNAAVGFRTD